MKKKWIYSFILLLYVLVLIYGTFSSKIGRIDEISENDKVIHFIAFFLLTVIEKSLMSDASTPSIQHNAPFVTGSLRASGPWVHLPPYVQAAGNHVQWNYDWKTKNQL